MRATLLESVEYLLCDVPSLSVLPEECSSALAGGSTGGATGSEVEEIDGRDGPSR